MRSGCNAGGVHYYLRTIRASYNEAVKRGIYKPESFVSPFKGVMPKLSNTKDKHFMLSEMKVLFANLPPKIKGIRPDYDYHYHNYFLFSGMSKVAE